MATRRHEIIGALADGSEELLKNFGGMQGVVGTEEAHVFAVGVLECQIPRIVDARIGRGLPPSHRGCMLGDDRQCGIR